LNQSFRLLRQAARELDLARRWYDDQRFGLGSLEEVWIRVLGAIITILAFYYLFAARHETKDFFWMTVWGRPAVLVFFTAFVLLGLPSRS